VNKVKQQIVWALQWDGPGMEHLRLEQHSNEIIADGMVIWAYQNLPLRIHYTVRCDASWAVRQVSVQANGSRLRLTADGAGHWSRTPGTPLPALDSCLDVDIAATPFTNTLPIRRLALKPGASAEITVAYITIPELSLSPARQRYTCLEARPDGGRYRYESLASGFSAELTVDAEGLVIDYQGIFRRICPR
jgi:hypothetical protein